MKAQLTPALCLVLSLATAAAATIVLARTASLSVAQSTSSRSVPDTSRALIHTCLITNDVKRLSAFYAQVLRIAPRNSGPDYVEFRTTAGTLALFSAAAQEK